MKKLDKFDPVKPPEEPEHSWSCCWQHPKCSEPSTHFHPIYGELCPGHAVEIIKTGEKVKRLKL